MLLAVEFAARRGSPQLAAVAAAIPTGTPLALLIIASKGGGQQALVQFSDACVRGIASSLGFAAAMSLGCGGKLHKSIADSYLCNFIENQKNLLNSMQFLRILVNSGQLL